MKIALTSERGVEILAVSESIAHHDTQILRAGLTKLLKTGKNKIVIELPVGQDLSAEVIRELVAFDMLARELSGRVVLARVSEALKTKIDAFSKPPVIMSFDTRQQAMSFLVPPPPKPEIAIAGGTPPRAGASVDPGAEAGARAYELEARLKELQQENQLLRQQVVATTLARRAPKDEAAFLERIEYLETKLDKMMDQLAAAGAAPKK